MVLPLPADPSGERLELDLLCVSCCSQADLPLFPAVRDFRSTKNAEFFCLRLTPQARSRILHLVFRSRQFQESLNPFNSLSISSCNLAGLGALPARSVFFDILFCVPGRWLGLPGRPIPAPFKTLKIAI